LQIGRCLMGLERYPEAIRAFDACIAIRSDEPWGYASRSLAYALAGNPQTALRELDRLIEKSSEFQPVLHLNRGFVHLLIRDSARALVDFDKIMQRPEEQRLSGAAYYRSQIRQRDGDSAAAMEDLDWIIGTDPLFTRAYVDRARLLFAAGQDSAALTDLETYLSLMNSNLDMHSWMACYQLGRQLLNVQEMTPPSQRERRSRLESLARERFEEAIRRGGNVEGLFQELGRLEFLADNHQSALKVYDQGIDRCPQSARLRLARAWLFVESNEAEAARELTATLQLEPRNPEAWAALGYVQARGQANVDAENSALEALLLSAQDYSALFNIAGIHGELGESDADRKDQHHRHAITLLQRALDMWKTDGSPSDRSIPDLMEREKTRAFRSLQFHPDYRRLLH
jgi:tetratricopeptide (TPR) repeat protein